MKPPWNALCHMTWSGVTCNNTFTTPYTDPIADQVQRALAHVGPLLNDLLLDFQGFFAKTILGRHGRELFNESKSVSYTHLTLPTIYSV